jgi:hypothetical protein
LGKGGGIDETVGNLPTDFEQVRMVAHLRRNILAFGVGLKVIAKLKPSLRGKQVMGVGRFERLHKERSPRLTPAASGKGSGLRFVGQYDPDFYHIP